ncbi:rhodanese-like domain-containing protein [Streptomyces sp. NPDC007883]|uniref:rhodanese-like domain-containing protein n=1 Tax=Streptomyces sp. NPDC007883 TaxID=3155116 RepID=UPI003401AD7E
MFHFRRNTSRITVDQARSRTNGEEPAAVLMDVREQAEWNAGHAPEAVHVPLTRLLARGGPPPEAEGKALVVICRSGHRSQQAAQLLNEHGAHAVDVEGGMNAWADAGHPVVDARGNSGRIA